MSAKRKFKTVEEYIESQPEDTKKTLLALRTIIMKTVHDATELFNYDIPAYALVKGGKRDKQIMIAEIEGEEPERRVSGFGRSISSRRGVEVSYREDERFARM